MGAMPGKGSKSYHEEMQGMTPPPDPASARAEAPCDCCGAACACADCAACGLAQPIG